MICGDPNPKGPGYREIPIAWALEGEHDGGEQRVAKGSWIDIPLLDLGTGERPLAFAATIWPTRIAVDRQAVLNWRSGDTTLTLGIGANGAFCRLATPGGLVDVDIGVPLTERAWHDIACLFDPAKGTLQLAQAPRKARLDRDERAEKSVSATKRPAHRCRCGRRRGRTFGAAAPICTSTARSNGRASSRASVASARCSRRNARAQSLRGTIIAEWDLSIGIPTDMAADIGPAKAHGRCMNLPTRAHDRLALDRRASIAGPSSRRNGARFTSTMTTSATPGWTPSLRFIVPKGLDERHVYALHLEKDGARDNIVFYACAAVAGSQAKVAFAGADLHLHRHYSQYPEEGPGGADHRAVAGLGRFLAQAPDGHPEYGVSPYNFHSDGSGVVMSTMRPALDRQAGHRIQILDPEPRKAPASAGSRPTVTSPI